MATDMMLTIPREGYNGFIRIMEYINTFDVHKWVIAAETGRTGYQHWQVRLKARHTFEQMKVFFPTAHIEECSDHYEYEMKEGKYLASWDTMDVRRQRFGKQRWYQEALVEAVRATNDREVVVWYDPEGNRGKSWLVGHLYETCEAYYVPPVYTTVQATVQAIASMAIEDRKKGYPPRPLILIDIPRSWKWSEQLYVAIESIKDGLMMDPRYSAQPINIRGCKVLVMTNEMPKLDKLSKDRWVIWRNPEML